MSTTSAAAGNGADSLLPYNNYLGGSTASASSTSSSPSTSSSKSESTASSERQSASSASSASSAPSLPPKHALLARPHRWLHAYDEFITRNLGQVSQIESALRSLTYIIPGRFRDAEIASEAIHSGVQLLSLYHDLLLLRGPDGGPAQISRLPGLESRGYDPLVSSPLADLQSTSPPPSQHTRYTRYWIKRSPFYRRVAIVLRVVCYTELLCEMAAKRRGERLRWRVVVLIEAIKAVCRLLLLRVTRGRTLLQSSLPARQLLPEGDAADEELDEMEEEELQDAENNTNKPSATAMSPGPDAAKRPLQTLSPQPPLSPPPSPLPAKATVDDVFGVKSLPPPAAQHKLPATMRDRPSAVSLANSKGGWTMPRTGMALPPLPQPGDISSYLLGRVLTADDVKPAPRLLSQLRGSGYAAEVLHILAPVVFAAALAATGTGSTSSAKDKPNRLAAWTPWLAGLAMECAARQLREYDNSRHGGLRTTTLEREEWNSRGWAMGWWAMRGAFYEHAMKGVVAGVRKRVPSFVGGLIEDYEYLWENYYFSSSP